MEKIKEMEVDADSDSEQIAKIDRNHNIDKHIQYAMTTATAMAMASTSYCTTEKCAANLNLYAGVPTTMDCETIIISSDSEDGYPQEEQVTSDDTNQNPNDDDTKDDHNSAHAQIKHENNEKLPKFESIAARRGMRSSKRPISYNEDELSVCRDDPDTSIEFPKGPTKPRFEVNPARIPKNDDTKMFYSNVLFKSMCLLCGCSDKHLANHYARKHPNTEVFIARLSPKYATRIRSQQDEFIQFNSHKDSKNSQIHGLCFFCEELKTMKPDDWKKHLLSHTGELQYWCTGCKLAMIRKTNHGQCSKDNVCNIFETNSSNDNLTGFICNTCNYLQIAEHRLIKHIQTEHDSFDDGCSELFSRVILVKSSAFE